MLLDPDWRPEEGLKNGGPGADWLGRAAGGAVGPWRSPARFKNTVSRVRGLLSGVDGARFAGAEGAEAARPADPDGGPGPVCPPPQHGPEPRLPERWSPPRLENNKYGG